MTVMTDANRFRMLEQIRNGDGFIAALDQSGGSTPGALKGYGIGEDRFSTDEEMFALIHAMRERVMTSPCFTGEKVIGAILFERTMDGEAGGKPVPELLWERGVVPEFSFVSTAGGAFLEWMEGRTLPGVAALEAR